MNQSTLIQAPLITGFFYFISRWFRAYVLRLGLFLFGSLVVFQVFQGQSFLNRFDFYAGLGILLPHIEIVELTYLILKEKVFTIYYKTLAFLQVIISPFVWLYAQINYFKEFHKAKQGEKQSKEDFSYKKWQEYQEEQTRNDEYEEEEYNYQEQQSYQKESTQDRYREYNEEEREQARQKQQRKQQEQAKKEEVNKHPRWDSLDPYIVLDIERTATFKEIKKKYRQLSTLYHPDKEQDEDKRKSNEEIFKKIGNAYEELEKKYK